MYYRLPLIILLVLSLGGCAAQSYYPDTERSRAAAAPAEVMQGLETTVDNILSEQEVVNSDVQELRQLKISTQQYYGKAPADTPYTEAKIELLTEEDVALAQEVLTQEGCWQEAKTGEETWRYALTRYQSKMGLPLSGRLDGATISKMRFQY